MANQLFKQSESIDWETYAHIHANMASAYAALENHTAAIQQYQIAIPAFQKAKCYDCQEYVINGYQSIAKLQLKLENTDACWTYVDSLNHYLALYGSSDKQRSISDEILAKLYLLQKDYTEALRHQQQALDQLRLFYPGREYHPDFAQRYFYLAEMYAEAGQYHAALQHCDSALYYMQYASGTETATQTAPHLRFILPPMILKAQMHEVLADQEEASDHLDMAWRHYEVANRLLAQLRQGMRNAKSKLLLSEKALPATEGAIQTAWALYEDSPSPEWPEQIFQRMESHKAAILQEMVQDQRIKAQLGMPDSLLQLEQRLKTESQFVLQKLHEAQQGDRSDSDKITGFEQLLTEKQQALQQLQYQLGQDYPQAQALRQPPPPPELIQIRGEVLQEDELLVEYFWGDHALWVVGMDQQELLIHRISNIEAIDSALQQLQALMGNRQLVEQMGEAMEHKTELASLSYGLYARILAPILQAFPHTQALLIIPDGGLNFLAFESLLQQETESNSFRQMPWLLRDYAIRYAYSARWLLQQSDRERAASTRFAAFAPAYTANGLYAMNRSHPLDSGLRSAFQPLLYNQQEAQYIQEILAGQVFLDSAANERRFKSLADQYQVLHLALHAFTDDARPAFSGLVFHPESQALGLNEGILHSYEIYGLQLQADLAVLSACNTGLGKLARGEGVMSLARAFSYAGCPNLLMSLWQADDESTMALMQHFYEHLAAGERFSQAIRLAKLDYLETADRPHPHYWAAFELIGTDGALEGRDRARWLWILWVLMALVLVRWSYMRKG